MIDKLKDILHNWLIERQISYEQDNQFYDLTFWTNDKMYKVMFRDLHQEKDHPVDYESKYLESLVLASNMEDDSNLWIITNHQDLQDFLALLGK